MTEIIGAASSAPFTDSVRPPLLLVAVAFGLSCSSAPPPTTAMLVARDPLDLPSPIARDRPAEVRVQLTAKEVIGYVADGAKAPVWTFDGKVPGPLIRARKGDTVVVRLTNDPGNRDPHSIDLHAMVGHMGGGDLTEVEPGETKELRFVAETAGAFFYHCAAEGMPWEHVAHGMYGAILVEPEGGLAPVDREIYVAQQEWYLGEAGAQGGDADEGALPRDVRPFDEEAAKRSEPTFFAWNGHRDALASPALFGERVHVREGARVRIVFANAGPNLPSAFHVVGAIFDRAYSGSFDVPARDEETVLVPPGSAAVFELSLPVAGDYSMVDHALYHAAQGARGTMHVDP